MASGADSAPNAIDPAALVELLEVLLLGERPTLTGAEVAERTGVDREVARARWKSLGFIQVPDDEPAFTPGDVHALELIERLHELGIADDENEGAIVRAFGRTFSRLADFGVQLLAESLDLEHFDPSEMAELVNETTPLLEEAMTYIWRRHLLRAAARVALGASGTDQPAMVVGFADIVGYTSRSRTMSVDQLAKLVDDFEARSLTIIGSHAGRIIKTIGDEVLFVADSPIQGARIALELAGLHSLDPEFPELRVGVAFGPVLSRAGDVFGPTVNIASRLTSVARPGTAVVDRQLADALEDAEAVKAKRIGRAVVKGYRHLEVYALKRPKGYPEGDTGPGLTGSAPE